MTRTNLVPSEQLIHSDGVKYPGDIDPVTLQPRAPEGTARPLNRQHIPDHITAFGFSPWKRPFIRAFLQGADVVFEKDHRAHRHNRPTDAIALWGSAAVPEGAQGAAVLRIEDGFLRSSGLGADLVRPLSLVIDDIGIYYDATRPSRLEQMIDATALDGASTARAQALRARIIALDLTKYNLGRQSWTRPQTDKRILLVVGQVETDASIHLGSPEVTSNIALLRRVRAQHPDAFIIYKPHPDVVAGLRGPGTGEDDCHNIANQVLTQPVSLGGMLPHIDEVHTMTSLLGFEAVLRQAKVVCHGLPFYAGWGLTEDRLTCPRRTRSCTLDELVHAALIDYPRYFNYDQNCLMAPEQAIDQLAALADTGPHRRSLARKALRLAIIAWLRITGSTR